MRLSCIILTDDVETYSRVISARYRKKHLQNEFLRHKIESITKHFYYLIRAPTKF